ncbi:MAG: hypothetical protein ABI646_07815 [Acidobacteriota bacterium]
MKCFALLIMVFVLGSVAEAQKPLVIKGAVEAVEVSPIKASPAYAELLLRKTELQSDLESLALEYTEEFPKIKELRFVLGKVDRDMARLGKVKPADSGKLTLALGKLMVRRVELEGDMWNLQRSYKDEHPEVKRAKRKVEIYDTAIGEILN